MCGIVGYVGRRECLPILIEGLKRLEYRGYDSAGVAIQDGGRVKPLDTFARESARRVGGARPFTGGETVAGQDAVD